jgi:hypothetical protein
MAEGNVSHPGREAHIPRPVAFRFPSFEHAEHEVLDLIGFYNDEGLHEALGDVPPSEYEAEHYRLNIKTDNTPMLAAT